MSDIRVPELGESIAEATILNWFKQVGDTIQAGETVLELETDKVNVEVMAEEQGVLDAILRQAGDTVTVGETVAKLRTDATVAGGEVRSRDVTTLLDGAVHSEAPVEDAPDKVIGRPLQEAEYLDRKVEQGQHIMTGPEGEVNVNRGQPAGSFNVPLRPTPSMRKQAREQGIHQIDNSPVASVASYTTSSTSTVPASAGSSRPNASNASLSKPERPDEERQRMTRRRLTIAKRLVEAQHTAAMLTTFNEVDMSSVLELRGRRKESFKDDHGVSLGFMSFFTKATVAALKRFPRLNAQIDGEDMILRRHYDIGVAVSTNGGLVVPVVREADRLSFAEIEQEIAELATKARSNTLGLEELQGGTFTITNGGVFGSLFSTPILNSPQVGILGMHGIKERPIAVDGQVVVRPMMYIALSYDHRIVDGAEAVQFLGMVKSLVEDPETLLLEG